MTNNEIAELLLKVAAGYQIIGENRFKIIAYDRAADSMEHLTSDAKDLWDDGKLSEIPGIGEGISHYLDELFRTGKVKHFDDVFKQVPEAVFPLLLIPGIGPKKAYRLVQEFKFNKAKTVVSDLEKTAKAGKIASLDGFGDKSQQDILSSIEIYRKGQVKENRMELPLADSIAQNVMLHLKKLGKIVDAIDVLGSLRRQVSTIGDIDIAVATKQPELVVDHFIKYPHQKLIEKGPTGASLLLHNGRQVDLRVQKPESYGAMLQYFTGSKNHNIKLRALAQEKGKSLNEYGIKSLKSGKTSSFPTEEEFYQEIGLPWIPPELREDMGEVEASLRSAQGKLPGLPNLVKVNDLRGDLHLHTNYDLKPSHDLGADPLEVYLDKAAALGYQYIGLSDHNPKISDLPSQQIIDIMKRRREYYEHKYSSWINKVSKNKSLDSQIKIFIMCEVDIQPNGSLALPEKAFEFVDAVIVSIHSSFAQPKKEMTQRVVTALTAHPKVRIFGHPTGRLLSKREGVELDWNEIFAVCKKQDIALEINAYPQRLDLPDTIVFDARKAGLRFCINTDAHAANQMDMMRYGVSVARRGWCEARDIVDCLEYNDFKGWLIKS